MLTVELLLLFIHIAMLEFADAAGGRGATAARKVLFKDGDVIIGALFPIHHADSNCTRVWPEYGIQRVEIALRTLQEINDNPAILPNVQLGIEIRDTCWNEQIAVEQTIEFLKAVMAEKGSGSGQCCDPLEASCKQHNGSLVAVIGPGSSGNSKGVHNLLQIFKIPQVGYSATSTELTNKNEYKYFMRVVPSDAWQAKAMVDILKHFNWTWVALVHTEDSYGQKGQEELLKLIGNESICVGVTATIKRHALEKDVDQIVNELVKTVRQQRLVVVCFCLGEDIRKMFQGIKRANDRQNATRLQFQWIGSESWADRIEVVLTDTIDVRKEAIGSLSLRIHSPQVDFDDYFLSKTPQNNPMNPWFGEFWEQQFNCSLDPDTATTYQTPCASLTNLSLARHYRRDAKLAQVSYAIYTIADALDKMFKNVCREYTGRGLCMQMRHIDGHALFQDYMRKVKLERYPSFPMRFDDNGDPPARYDIINFQQLDNGTFDYRTVGEWNSDSSKTGSAISINQVVQYLNREWSNESDAPPSACSMPCPKNHYQKSDNLHRKCCWTCFPCAENEYSKDKNKCEKCAEGQGVTDDGTGCYNYTVEYLRWESPEAVVAVAVACMGIMATACTLIVFLRFHHTPIIKSTTRELSYIILVGIFLCYVTTFVVVQRPSPVTCYLVRVIPGLAFAMIYGALLTKTNRIARILERGKKRNWTKKPRFLSITAQLVFTWCFVGVEACIIAAMLLYEPADEKFDYSLLRRVLLVCNTSSLGVLAPFGFDFCLILLCTIYAVKTRNLPENFNEAKFVGFTMYTTCIIWLGFVAIYFGSERKSITMCFCFSLSATVALVLLFFPKLYVVLFQPHKNVRSTFATSKVIRCHFGTTPTQSVSTTIHESSRYPPRTGPSQRSAASHQTLPESDQSGLVIRKHNFKESVHVPDPKLRPQVQINETKYSASVKHVTLFKPSSETAQGDLSASCPVSYVTRTSQSYASQQPQLSVIEESLPSHHEDSLDPAETHHSTMNGRCELSTQTEFELLQSLFYSWQKPPCAAPNSYEGLRRRSSRFQRLSGRRKAITGQNTDENFQQVMLYRLQQYENNYSPSASPLLSRHSSVSDQVDQNVYVGDQDISDGEMPPASGQHRRSKHLVASSLGSAFQTFLSTAVPVKEDEHIYLTAEICDAEAKTIEHSLASAVSPLVSPVYGRAPTLPPEVSRSPSPPTSPRLKRSDSLLNKLGYSIRRRMQGQANTASRQSVDYSLLQMDQQGMSQVDSADYADPWLPRVDEHNAEHNPWTPRQIGERRMKNRAGSQDSDAADSGFVSRPPELVTSFDSHSSQRSSGKSKRGSCKARIKPAASNKTSSTADARSTVSRNDKSTVMDAIEDEPPSSGAWHELQERLENEGVQIAGSTQSTLV